VWWTESKQKKIKKFKDELKIFHKLCSSQVKENLKYSQDFVASTVFWIIIPVKKRVNNNKQSHIQYLIAKSIYQYLPIKFT